MSLQLIYGRAGTGKSTVILEQVKNNLHSEVKQYIIIPEQFSYSEEKKLMAELQENSIINAEVITFKRMAERVQTEVAGRTKSLLSKSGKAMIMYSILDKQKDKLQYIKNSSNNIDLGIQTIKDFKKNVIKYQDIEELIESVDKPLLKAKLQDVNIIYSEYEKCIQEKFLDEEDKISKLADNLETSTMFDNSDIYIDEFSGFTKQEYQVIAKLLKKARKVRLAICLDELNEKNKTDIFYFNKSAVEELIDIATECGVEVEKPIYLNKQYKLKKPELKHLEQNLYAPTYAKYAGEVKNIKTILTLNPYEEIEYVAKNIIKLVRDEGYKYSDIAIIARNIDEVQSKVKAILGNNGIPVFIDNKEDLARSQFIKYILALLEILAKNWSQEAVISYIKSGFLKIDEDDIYKLENYVIKWGIQGSKWYKEDWKYEEENFNELREKIVLPILDLKAKLEGQKTATNISKAIYSFLDKNDIYTQIEEKIKKYEESGNILLSKNCKASLENLIEVLDEIIYIFEDQKMSFEKYREILKIGLSYKELGNIPEVIDQVILGDIERSRSHEIKIAFILGVNDGNFPSINKIEGFLNDDDRETLKSLGKEIAKGSLELTYEDQFNIYKALTTAKEKLYLMYTSTDKDGATLRQSILITKIKRIFPNLKEESTILNSEPEITSKQATFQELLFELQKLKNGEQIDDIWYEVYNWYKTDPKWSNILEKAMIELKYLKTPEKISKENIEKLYGKTLKTSISKLETYRRCPFQYHLKYGLKLQEKEEFKVRAIDTGSFMHEVIEEFFRRAEDVKKITEEEISKLVDEIILDKLSLRKNYLFTSNKKFIALTNRLKRIINKSLGYIVYQIQNSDFTVLANEVEFSKTINNVEITGKIDRVDISNDGDFLRVIDYKSSSKNINLNDVFSRNTNTAFNIYGYYC